MLYLMIIKIQDNITSVNYVNEIKMKNFFFFYQFTPNKGIMPLSRKGLLGVKEK